MTKENFAERRENGSEDGLGEWFENQRAGGIPVLLDGGLATELEKRGQDLNHPLWSAKLLTENPALIAEIHREYAAAGAQILTTASYQASWQGLLQSGFQEDEAREILKRSVEVAKVGGKRANRSAELKIAASVGSYGAFLANGDEYRGGYGLSVSDLIDFHEPRIAILSETDADLLAFETIPDFKEIQALINLNSKYPQKPAWLSLSTRDEKHLADGTPLEKVVELVLGKGDFVALGLNCCPPARILPVLNRLRTAGWKGPMIAYPNSGEQWDGKKHCWTGEAKETFQLAQKWFRAGATLIGGCCRTSPDDIRELKKLFQENGA